MQSLERCSDFEVGPVSYNRVVTPNSAMLRQDDITELLRAYTKVVVQNGDGHLRLWSSRTKICH